MVVGLKVFEVRASNPIIFSVRFPLRGRQQNLHLQGVLALSDGMVCILLTQGHIANFH